MQLGHTVTAHVLQDAQDFVDAGCRSEGSLSNLCVPRVPAPWPPVVRRPPRPSRSHSSHIFNADPVPRVPRASGGDAAPVSDRFLKLGDVLAFESNQDNGYLSVEGCVSAKEATGLAAR